MASAAAAAAMADFMSDNSPLNMLMIAVLIGSAAHLIISLLVTLKNVGMRVYLVIQLAGLWYLLPVGMRLELYEHLKREALFVYSATEALVRMIYSSTSGGAAAAAAASGGGECQHPK